MDGEQFCRFLSSPEGVSRKKSFIRLPADEAEDSTLIIECDKTTIAEWRSDLNRHDYLQRVQAEMGYSTVSLYDLLINDGGTMTREEVLADPDQESVEDCALINLEKGSLRAALTHLTKREYSFIYYLFLREPPLSVAECAKALGLSRTDVVFHRERIIKKLRNLME